MSRREARTEIIRALAEMRRRDPVDIETEALVAGAECPYDSVWLVKAGVRAARRLGFKLKPTKSDAHAFKSIESLASHLYGLARNQNAA
ncbi:MAG: hypothetical protein ABSH36_05725 [Solirubrobacteraceae bacterium]|jgi:hypothetical protein